MSKDHIMHQPPRGQNPQTHAKNKLWNISSEHVCRTFTLCFCFFWGGEYCVGVNCCCWYPRCGYQSCILRWLEWLGHLCQTLKSQTPKHWPKDARTATTAPTRTASLAAPAQTGTCVQKSSNTQAIGRVSAHVCPRRWAIRITGSGVGVQLRTLPYLAM